jgi:hypothetical protein
VLWRWAFAHIREEILERVSPSVADRDSAPAVSVVLLVGGVVTTFFHPFPDSVFSGFGHPVSRSALVENFEPQASAGFGGTVPQFGAPHNSGVPAIASAEPTPLPLGVSVEGGKRNQATEPMVCYIDSSGHR